MSAVKISRMFSRQMKAIVYIDARVLLENTPLVKFIRNYIRDSIIIIGVFSVSSQLKIIFTCSVHSNIKFISSRHRATSSIYSMSTLARFLWWLSIWHLIHYYIRPCSVSSITSIFILLKWKTKLKEVMKTCLFIAVLILSQVDTEAMRSKSWNNVSTSLTRKWRE